MPTALPRFLLLFTALYLAFGVVSPFFPLFLSSRGVSAEEIGSLLSLAGLVRLVSGPFAGRIADRLHAARWVLTACCLGAGVFALSFLPAHAFSILLAIALCHAAMLAPTTSLADALALRNATPSGACRGFEYGWVRGAGSAAFIVGSLVAGRVLDTYPPATALVGQAALLLCAAAASLVVPDIVVAQEVEQRPGQTRAVLALLLANQPFCLIVLVAAVILGSHAMHDSFAMIAWTRAGIRPGSGSILWSESVAAEVAVFVLLGPWLLRRITPVQAMGIAACAAMLRWTVLGASSSAVALALVEPLHGLSFALLHLACMRILVVVTPASIAATAQTIYAFGIGAATVLLTFASGFLYADFGSAGFLAMAALAAMSLPLIWALAHALRRAEFARATQNG
jgi:PPP family 3-phenylpropionic acid transporter